MLTFCGIGASQLIATQIVTVVFLGFAQGRVHGYDLYEGNSCKLKDGTPGVCTIIDQCVSVYQGLLTNKLPYTQVAENRCGFVKQKEVVCCPDSRPDPTNSRITSKVPTPTRSGGSAEWSLVSGPLVENEKLNNQNVESVGAQDSAVGQNENEDKLSSRFFLGNLLSPQNSRNTLQNPHAQSQQGNVQCANYYIPTTTTPLPVQRRSGIFGFLNFNKPAQTTPRTSVLAPVIDALRPIKEIPLNFISSIGKRHGINLQGQFNVNPRQPGTFDSNNNDLCVESNAGETQGGQNPNTFVPQYSMNGNQPMQPFQSLPMQIPSIDPTQNVWNIPNQPMSAPFVPLNFMNGNQPMLPFQSMTPVQNQNQNPNQNQHIWNVPVSPTSVTFGLPNSVNGNQLFQPAQPMATFQPIPTMQNPNNNQNKVWNILNPVKPSQFVDNTFGTTSTQPVIETNRNWDKKDFPDKVQITKPTIDANQAWNVKDSDNFNTSPEVSEQPIRNFRTTTTAPLNNGNAVLEPWMVESLRATTNVTTTSTTRTPKTDPSQLDPWMEAALRESSSKRPIVNQQEYRNPKPSITQPNIAVAVKPDSDKNEQLQNSPSSVLDPWMVEALGETSTSTQLPTNPDRPKKDTPNIPSLQNSQNTTTSFGDSILDPWMKEALQEGLRSTTSTQRTTHMSVPVEIIPPSIREFPGANNNNENTVLDPWMAEALGAVSSAKPSINANPSTEPTSLRPPVAQDSHLEEAVGISLSSFDRESEIGVTQSSKRAADSSHDSVERSRHPDSSKFTSSSNTSPNLPADTWVWDQKETQPKSTNISDEDVNYWMSEALKPKTKPPKDKAFGNFESHTASIQSDPNSREKHFGRENLGVGKPLPRPRNGTNRVNNGLFNEIFDIPDNRGGDGTDGEVIGSRSSDGAAAACVKYKREFGVAVTYHILGGIAAQLGEFAHMAALGYPSTAANREFDWNCGASLISDLYLVTSAHCITRSGPTKARLGKISIDTDEDGATAQDFDIEESILYPNYTNAKQYDDIALLRLNRKVNYTENVRPACLNTNKNPMPPSTSVTVTGWGTISLRTRSRSSVLLKANLTTVELNECNQAHTDYGHNRKLPLGLTETQICAYDPELVKDACEGDSGGPLQIVDDSGISTIYGITSFGVSCASKIPGVYARVSHYLEWIESIVWP